MKFTVHRSALLASLLGTKNVASTGAVAILAHVLIDLVDEDGGTIYTTVTDYDVILQHRAVVEDAEGFGRCALHARTLFDILTVLPDIPVTVKVEDIGRVSLQAGNATYDLLGADPNDFPETRKFQKATAVGIRSAHLQRLLSRVSFAMSTEEARLNLNGVHIDCKDDVVHMVATDGHRLAMTWYMDAAEDAGPFGETTGIVHRSGIATLLKLLDATVCPVFFEQFDNEYIFDVGDRTALAVREIDETYPDWRTIVPKSEGATIFRVDVCELLESLRRVKPLVDEGSCTVRLAVSPESMTVSCRSPMFGTASVEIYADYDGPVGRTVGFNHKYLTEAICTFESPMAEFQLHDGGTCVLRPSDEAETTMHIIMAVMDEDGPPLLRTVDGEEGGSEETPTAKGD